MIAFVGGTSLIDSTIFQGWTQKKVKTPFGAVTLKEYRGSLFLQRHGNPPLPPHRIDHRANIWALKCAGAREIISVNSVGSLKLSSKPGSFIVPDDFISFCDVPTFFNEEMRFMVPVMDRAYGSRLFKHCKAMMMPVSFGGIYIQTKGPRLETKAEIAMLKRFGDVVGMTMASEATLSLEYGIPYASLCSVDNYCHGIAKKPLTMDKIQINVRSNLKRIEAVIDSINRDGLP